MAWVAQGKQIQMQSYGTALSNAGAGLLTKYGGRTGRDGGGPG